MPVTNKDPSTAVKDILRERNVQLTKCIKNHLGRFALHLRKHKLIEEEVERSMSVPGITPIQLAKRLITACSPLLVHYPVRNFPKFIAIMKEFEDMLELAEEMEADYEQASMLQSTFNVS